MGKASRWLKSLLGMKRDKEAPAPPNQNNKKDKRRWSFTNSGNDSVPPPRRISLNIPAATAGDAAWLRDYLSEKDDKHAIAVAAATAAAAEAAMAATQAAMAVVRLTNQGRSRDRWAAVKIQTVFRGYLARKALKALKGLVKLQANVRGFLVRKRATATLHSMQALIRAQSTARFLRPASPSQPRISEERFDKSRSELHSKKVSDLCHDDPAKIVEIDTYYYNKPRSHRHENYAHVSEYGDHDMHAFPISGPIASPFLTPAKISVPSRCYEWGSYENEYGQFRGHRRTSSTDHSTTRFANLADGPFTPVCHEGMFRPYHQPHRLSGSYHPNYMASTQSFEAKSRSQSAPKQRPTQPSPSKKRMPLEKVMECRHSLSGVRMNRSYSEDTEALHF